MKKLFLTLIIVLSWGMADAAYEAIPSNYESTYNPTSWASGEKTLSLDVQDPGNTFRVFIPGGAKSVSLITYSERDVRLGIMTRFGMAPQCSYNSNKSEKEYYALPWNDNTGTGISGINGKDYQCNNWGGYTRILDRHFDPLASDQAGWVYVKGVSYDGSGSVRSMAFYVTVDVDAYKAWYEGATWNRNVPTGNPGASGGYCDPLWAKAGTGGNEPGPDDPVEPEQNLTEFECIFIKGGVWIDGECILEEPEPVEPEPEPIEPELPKTIVFQFNNGIVMQLVFKPDGVLTIISEGASLDWRYEDTEDFIVIKQP